MDIRTRMKLFIPIGSRHLLRHHLMMSTCFLLSTLLAVAGLRGQTAPQFQNPQPGYGAQQPAQPQFRTPTRFNPTTQFTQPTGVAQPNPVQNQPTQIQRVSYDASHSLAANQVLQQGIELESQGKWSEALSLYQKALRKSPHDRAISQRRSVARIHFDLDRRYSDVSFLKTVRTTNGATALNVYAEVLLKVQSYYVDEPNWGKLANFGLTSLEVAMKNDEFRNSQLPNVSEAAAKNAFKYVLQSVQRMPATNRHEVYMIANQAAKMMQNQLGLPKQVTVYEFVCGAISALDPYSAFMSSNQYSETMSQIEGNFVGLGVELKTHKDNLEIISVIPGGSAASAGVAAGDRITSVDGNTVEQAGSERAADMLRGVEGSRVRLIVLRNGRTIPLQLERRRVDIPSVDKVQLVDQENKVGYVRLTNFQKTTARDFDAALWKLHRQGMRSLIVDVRGNPGGLLSASVEVADRFVNHGVIVSTRGRNPMEDYTHRAQNSNTWRVPLVVLLDENSASASEIFAAAIRDHQRGTIVGRQSYGKGSVQGIFPLNSSGGGVRLTTAKFYSPTGKKISEVGVNADVEVVTAAKPAEGEKPEGDQDLRVGIQIANRMAKQRETKNRRSVAGR